RTISKGTNSRAQSSRSCAAKDTIDPHSVRRTTLRGAQVSYRRSPKRIGTVLKRDCSPEARMSLMNHTHADPPAAEATFSAEDVLTCVRVLRAIEADRSHLTRLTREQRRELLTLAGLVAKPERHNLVQMAKAFRRADRVAAREHDRKAIEQA